jgi:hypothetical protein
MAGPDLRPRIGNCLQVDRVGGRNKLGFGAGQLRGIAGQSGSERNEATFASVHDFRRG